MTTHDAIIVGGGPAGLSAAQALRRLGVEDIGQKALLNFWSNQDCPKKHQQSERFSCSCAGARAVKIDGAALSEVSTSWPLSLHWQTASGEE